MLNCACLTAVSPGTEVDLSKILFTFVSVSNLINNREGLQGLVMAVEYVAGPTRSSDGCGICRMAYLREFL